MEKHPIDTQPHQIFAVLVDGQEFSDEAHLGSYAGRTLTPEEAEAAIADLYESRDDVGHEDVEYQSRPIPI